MSANTEDNDAGSRETRPRYGTRPLRWLSPTGELRGLDIEHPRPAPARQPGLPAWKRLLERMRRACQGGIVGRSWPAERQIVYIVDVPCSLEDRSLVVRLGCREQRADGQWGRPRTRGVVPPPVAELADGEDQDLLAALYSAAEAIGPATRQGAGYRIPAPLRRRLLERMCRTGRALVMHDAADDDYAPLAWDAGGTWQFVIVGQYDGASQVFVLDGVLRRAGQSVPVRSAALAMEGGVVIFGTLAAALDDGGAPRWLEVFREQKPLCVPEAQAGQFLRELAAVGPVPPMELPVQLGVGTVHVAPVPVLRIRAAREDERRPDRLRGRLSFDYDDAEIAPDAGDVPAVFDIARRRIVVRNLPAERDAAELLLRTGLREAPAPPGTGREYWFHQRHLVRVVRRLVAAGWRVEALGKLYRAAGQSRFAVSSGMDFFELRAAVDFESQSVDLPAVVAAARRGEPFVPLGDGSMGVVPEDFLRRCELAAATGRAAGDALRFSSRQLCLLEAIVASSAATAWDQTAASARERLATIAPPAPQPAPPTFAGTLRPYQCEGMGWMEFLRKMGFGGCLADDMGLGKTVQVLALLESRRLLRLSGEPLPPSLVVVPSSLVFNWIAEAARFTPQLRMLEHTGTDRARGPEDFEGWDAVVTTYGIVRRDIPMLRTMEFDYIVLDEAHAIKNPASDSARAVRLLRGRHRLALTGTPVQNNLGDLWSIFEFLNPGMLGSASFLAGGAAALRSADAEARAVLARALRPFILRRTKQQVASELPARLQQTLWCELENEQRRLYDELRDYYRRSLLARVHNEGVQACRFQVLEALLRLRQAAIHPGLVDPALVSAPSAKLDTLLSRIDEVLAEGHKALVFSQFVSMLSIVRSSLEARNISYEYLDGKTRDRAARVQRFQTDPSCRLFLISLKAGGLGLNLTAADHVFLLDPWWNPAIEDQAIDRAHRIGQTRVVHACRLISRGTVEEKVIALQESKRQLADAIITADNSLLRMLGRDELEMLLS